MNTQRDKKRRVKLMRQGWDVVVVWQCQLGKPDWIYKRTDAFKKS